VLFICVVFLFFTNAKAQDSIALRYSNLIKPDEIKSYLEVLSSDSLEGRETGKRGQKRATRYISNHFQSVKLSKPLLNSYTQDIFLSIQANKGKNFEVNQKFYLFMKNYYYLSGLKDTIFAIDSIVFAGYGIKNHNYNDYENITVKDKAIMVYEGRPQNKKGIKNVEQKNGWNEIVTTASYEKASLVLIITDSLEKVIDRLNYSDVKLSENSPHFAFITPEMAKSFLPEIHNYGIINAKKDIDRKRKPQSFAFATTSDTLPFIKDTEKLKGQNVIGYVEGTDKKDEFVVISAHYDHLGIKDSLIYYGADDNGSGTSAIMQLAKIFALAKAEGHSPRRSILFMMVSGEEKGLLGSAYYVKHPLFPLANIMVDLNIDMIGRTDSVHDTCHVRDYIYIIGSDKLSTELHRINEKANATYTKLELDYHYNTPGDKNRYYYRSDHYNFAKNNIPVIFYFNGMHADYHKPTDTIDKIDFELLAKRAKLVFFTAWDLANREERIKVDVKNEFENKKEN
jgi:hypothetical protein